MAEAALKLKVLLDRLQASGSVGDLGLLRNSYVGLQCPLDRQIVSEHPGGREAQLGSARLVGCQGHHQDDTIGQGDSKSG